MLIRCPHCEYARTISATKIPPTAEVATCPKCKARFRFRSLDPDEKPAPKTPETANEKAPADIWEAVDAISRTLPPISPSSKNRPEQTAPGTDQRKRRDSGRETDTRERRRDEAPARHVTPVREPRRRREDTLVPEEPRRRRDDQPATEVPRRRQSDRPTPIEEYAETRQGPAGEPAYVYTDRQDPATPEHTGNAYEADAEAEYRRELAAARAAARNAPQGPGIFAKSAAAAAATFKAPIAWAVRRLAAMQEKRNDTARSAGYEPQESTAAEASSLAVERVAHHPAAAAEPAGQTLGYISSVESTSGYPAPVEEETPPPYEAQWAGEAMEQEQPWSERTSEETSEGTGEAPLPELMQDYAADDATFHREQPAGEAPAAEEIPDYAAVGSEAVEATEEAASLEAAASAEETPAGHDEESASLREASPFRQTPPAHSDGPAVFPYGGEDSAAPEERVARDILLLQNQGERPIRDLGPIELWTPVEEESIVRHTDIPWENQERYGRFGGFTGTVRRTLLHPTAFFSGLPPFGSLAPAYLYFIIQSYIALLCTLLWRLAVAGVLGDTALFPPGRLSLPILLLLTPLFMGLVLMFCTGVIRTFLRIMAPEQADFPAAFKIICYAASAFVFCIIPLIGPAVAWIWFCAAMISGFRHSLGLSWSMAALTALLPAVLLPGSMIALFF